MFKCSKESLAYSLAKEHGLAYGCSVFDGKFYVGSAAELSKIGCPTATQPSRWLRTLVGVFVEDCDMCGRPFDTNEFCLTDGDVSVCSKDCADYYDGVEPPEVDDEPTTATLTTDKDF